MKKLSVLAFVLVLPSLILFSCGDCTEDIPPCQDLPPTNEACTAQFVRWFYDKDTKTCGQISYTGCSEYGFETEQACEACDCD